MHRKKAVEASKKNMQSKKDIKKYLPIDIQERITAHEMKILIPFYFSEWKKNMDKCYKIELVESNMHVKWCGIKFADEIDDIKIVRLLNSAAEMVSIVLWMLM